MSNTSSKAALSYSQNRDGSQVTPFAVDVTAALATAFMGQTAPNGQHMHSLTDCAETRALGGGIEQRSMTKSQTTHLEDGSGCLSEAALYQSRNASESLSGTGGV